MDLGSILDRIGSQRQMLRDSKDVHDEMSLMVRVAAGDARAFEVILDGHMLAIYHFAYSIVRDACAAEDVTQETCVKLWRNANNWVPDGRLRSWLFRIAHNLCIDEIRRRRPHADIEMFAESLAGDGRDAGDALHESDVSRVVKAALFELPVRQRTALMLVHYSDFSNNEAAATMEISVDALESLLARGRRGLKDILGKHKDKLWEG